MKILVISHMYPSSQNQAYGIFIHEQVKALKEQGIEVRVISPVPYAPWPLPLMKKKWQSYAAIPARDIREGVQVYYPRYPEFPKSYLLEHSGQLMYLGMRSLIRSLRSEFQFDLLHAHVALPDGHAALLLKERYGVPAVVTVHGQDFQSTLRRGKRPRARLSHVLGGIDRIITVSSKLKNIVRDEPYAGKIEVINNGINPEAWQETDEVRPSCRFDKKIKTADKIETAKKLKIVSVSNLKKTKGIDLNLKAVAALVPKYPDLVYCIAGDGEERQNLEYLAAQLKIEEHVVFLGRLTHPQALAQMAAADIFCLPSWQEGFGVVYIEAMAQNVPVIGVQGEGIEDVITHGRNGLLVRPRNVEDIIQSIDLLLSKREYAGKLAQAGRDTVLTNFTWTQNARKTQDLYHKLLS